MKNREGYINVDRRSEGNPDIVADIREVEFRDDEFEEILIFDVIEHLNFTEARKLLRRCWSWLESNGSIQIHTQNMRYIASVLAEDDSVEALRWVYGSLGEGDTDYDGGFHRWGYTPSGMAKILENIGFKVVVSEEDSMGFGMRITALKK